MEMESFLKKLFNNEGEYKKCIQVPLGVDAGEEYSVSAYFGGAESRSLLISGGIFTHRLSTLNNCMRLMHTLNNGNIEIKVIRSTNHLQNGAKELIPGVDVMPVTGAIQLAQVLTLIKRIDEDRYNVLKHLGIRDMYEFNSHVKRMMGKPLTAEERMLLDTDCEMWEHCHLMQPTVIIVEEIHEKLKGCDGWDKSTVHNAISTLLKWSIVTGMFSIVSVDNAKLVQEEYQDSFDTELVIDGDENFYTYACDSTDSGYVAAKFNRYGNIDTEVVVKVPLIQYK